MKIFLDTANRKAIEHWAQTGIVDGVTTNPTHLAQEGGDPQQVVKDICQMLPQKAVSVEVTVTEPDEIYKQAKNIAGLADNVVVKIPCHVDYYGAICTLVREGVAINVTLLFTLIQALFMAKLGVEYISPFIGRWDDIDIEGSDLLAQIRYMLDEYSYETKLLAASLRGVRHINSAIVAGADVATVPIAVLEKAVTHPLTEHGIEKFLADWHKLDIKRFP